MVYVIAAILAYPAAVLAFYVGLALRSHVWKWGATLQPGSYACMASRRGARFLRTFLWPLFRGKVDAVTSGCSTLYLTDALADDLVDHEYCHRRQAMRYGEIRYAFMYAWEYLRHGYRNNKFEREARVFAGQEAASGAEK